MLTEEKFTQTVEKYMDMVYRVALNYLHDASAAEDVCQEVFMRLLKSDREFSGEEHCKHWLVRVAINESKRALASSWRRLETIDEGCAAELCDSQADREVLQLVLGLPRKYSLVLYLYYYDGYSTGEIAKLLRCPASTVRSHLDRGRKKLKEGLMEAENV